MSVRDYGVRGGVGPVPDTPSVPALAGQESRPRQGAAAEGGNSVPVPTPAAQEPAASAAEVARAVARLNDYVQTISRVLQFSIDEASGHTVIKVLDALSGQVIRQIPEQEALALAKTVTPDGQAPRLGFLMVGKA